MPLFDFFCKKCRYTKEYLVKLDVSDAPKKCLKCGGKLVKQLPNRFSMDFIGPGFYINDYGKHNWKKGKSPSQIADVLNNKKDPY